MCSRQQERPQTHKNWRHTRLANTQRCHNPPAVSWPGIILLPLHTNFADIATPLHMLTQKTTLFIWSQKCENAFNALKSCLTQPCANLSIIFHWLWIVCNTHRCQWYWFGAVLHVVLHISYLLDQMLRLLFISFINFVQFLFESGNYSRAAFICSANPFTDVEESEVA